MTAMVYKKLRRVIGVNYVTLGNYKLTYKNHKIRKALGLLKRRMGHPSLGFTP